MVKNFKSIQEEFNKVISYSQGISEPKTDELFERWLEAKRDIIEAMDGRLIYTVPHKVSFELSYREKMNRVNEFIESVAMTWRNNELACFIDENKDGFFSNVVVETFTSPRGAKIPKGMKLVKAFKFFEDDRMTLEEIQNRASMIIQEDKVEGWLCFSVHPLDFLSTSENTYNWRSCHALDGEYRCGNLSYMMDKSTVVCYLKSDKDDNVLPNFPTDVKWNSKKWRMLLFLSDHWNAMFAGRQYPFFSETALETVRYHSMNVFKMHGEWSNWHNDELKNFEFANDESHADDIYFRNIYIPIRGKLYTKSELIEDCDNPMHFNDLLRSSCYIPYYCWNKRWGYHDAVHFTIGGEIPCLRCGEYPIAQTDDMLCRDCELEYGSSEDEAYITCSCCGRRILYDDSYYVESSGENICEHCADHECRSCDCCGELYWNNDISYDKKNHDYRCEHCHSENQERAERMREFIAATLPF